MLPPLAASAFGAVLAGGFDIVPSGLHLLAVFLAVYTAHVKDGYVDFHGRGEDDDHPLTARGCRLALLGASAGFGLVVLALALADGPVAAALTAPGWLIGYLHAPHLDVRPTTATAGYPVGVGLALAGGYYVAAGTLSPAVLAVGGVFVLALSGVKVVDDAADHDYDRRIGKRTVAVVVGPDRARRVATVLMAAGMVAVLPLSVEGVLPSSAPLAAVAFGAVAALAVRAPPAHATKLLVRGAYVFLAVLVAAVWFHPLAGVPLPDVGVLGPYTYLATEVAFGSVAAVLLWRTSAWWAAARTVAVLYPVAYVWDWYSLEIGVFSIPLRTGVELVGIPLEEHLFMVVVPSLVVGVHEALRRPDDRAVSPRSRRP
jgi:lycopene cyclase domain-containing protein